MILHTTGMIPALYSFILIRTNITKYTKTKFKKKMLFTSTVSDPIRFNHDGYSSALRISGPNE